MLKFVPFPLLFGLILLVILLFLLRRGGSRFSYLFLFSLFWLYLLGVVAATLFPMPLPFLAGGQVDRSSAGYILSQINLAPFDYSQFRYESPRYIFAREILANILLTLPFGFGISFVASVRRKDILWLAPAVGIGIESCQLIAGLILGVNYREVDINDAIMNALGVLAGYGLFMLFARYLVERAPWHRIRPRELGVYLYLVARRARLTHPADR